MLYFWVFLGDGLSDCHEPLHSQIHGLPHAYQGPQGTVRLDRPLLGIYKGGDLKSEMYTKWIKYTIELILGKIQELGPGEEGIIICGRLVPNVAGRI